MMRATAITLMLEGGVANQGVKEFSGHTPNSKSFERYVGSLSREAKDKNYDIYKKMLAI